MRESALTMVQRIVLIGVLLLAPLSIASAGDAPDESEKCIGPMCLFTPIYRLGKSVMPAEPVPSAAPPNAPQPPDSTAETPKAEPLSSADVQSDAPKDGSRVTGKDEDEASLGAADIEQKPAPRSRSRQPLRVKRQAARIIAHSVRGPVKATSTAASVTVSAAEPEMSRLLALASMVKTPSISVIPDNGFGVGCSADYVVDTLLNPTRLGPAIPLFSESLIIVTRDNISSIRELRGRRVSFGPSGGSSERVAKRLFKSLEIPVDGLPLDIDNALDGLALGDLDAVALLVPRGYDRFATHDSHLHVLGLEAGTVPPEGLRVSRIEPSSYLGGSWSNRSVSVIVVDAVLSPNREATRHPSAMSLYAALNRGASRLAQNGFDLIGEDSEPITMRSVAKNVDPQPVASIPVDRNSFQKGCGR